MIWLLTNLNFQMFNSFGSPLKYFEKTNHENNFTKKFFLKVILKLHEKCDKLDIWFWTLPLRVEEWVFKIMMSKTFLLFFAIFSTFPKEHEHVLYGTGFWDSISKLLRRKKKENLRVLNLAILSLVSWMFSSTGTKIIVLFM